MSWINTNEDHRWTKEALQARAAGNLAYQFPEADRLRLRAHAVATGIAFMDATEKERWAEFIAAEGTLQAQVEEEWKLMQDLGRCFDIEAAQLALRQIPPEDLDRVAQAQESLDALVASASAVALTLVVDRKRYPAEA